MDRKNGIFITMFVIFPAVVLMFNIIFLIVKDEWFIGGESIYGFIGFLVFYYVFVTFVWFVFIRKQKN